MVSRTKGVTMKSLAGVQKKTGRTCACKSCRYFFTNDPRFPDADNNHLAGSIQYSLNNLGEFVIDSILQ